MYLSCLCAAIFFVHLASGLTLASLTLDMLWTNEGCIAGHAVACCKMRGWNIICIARKEIRYKSMLLFFFFSFTRKDLGWRDQMNLLTQQLQTSHRLARVSCCAWTADIDDWHTITTCDFLFYFTLRHRSRATLRANGGKAGGTGELEGRKQEGVADLTESVCLKCKQSGAHRGC